MQAADQFDAAVLAFMDDYAVECQYVKTESVYNPSTGGVTETEETFDIKGILVDLTLQSNGYSVKYGTMVEAGDKEIYVRPPSRVNANNDDPVINPATDKIVVGSVHYKIVTFKEINPDGSTPLVWTFYVRR